VIVAEVQGAGRPHAGENTVREHGFIEKAKR
jgi:hypothetical protein